MAKRPVDRVRGGQQVAHGIGVIPMLICQTPERLGQGAGALAEDLVRIRAASCRIASHAKNSITPQVLGLSQLSAGEPHARQHR